MCIIESHEAVLNSPHNIFSIFCLCSKCVPYLGVSVPDLPANIHTFLNINLPSRDPETDFINMMVREAVGPRGLQLGT